jgi:IS5 family transposase
MVLRLLVLKHLRQWSYATLEREVRTNLVYRVFTRVGGGNVPDAKTMGRWGLAVAPAVVAQLHQRIITEYVVYDTRPSDSDLLLPALAAHTQTFGHVPRLVAADAAFYSAANEAAAHALGVTRVCIPNAATKSASRKREQKKRWFKNGQKWRTGCEGRISVVKRRHGLNRSRYKGEAGMKRWVGLGVIADNLINIGRVLATRPSP